MSETCTTTCGHPAVYRDRNGYLRCCLCGDLVPIPKSWLTPRQTTAQIVQPTPQVRLEKR